MVRTIKPFNHDWLFSPNECSSDETDAHFKVITLPHSNKIFPYHSFDDKEYQFVSTYKKRFLLSEKLNGRRLFIDFEGVMNAATVTINGHSFPEHRGGFVPFSFDITDYIHENEENLLHVQVDSIERHDIPPYGYTVDYMTFGGIYREVNLRYVNPVYIENTFVKCFDPLGEQTLEVDLAVENHLQNVTNIELRCAIYDGDMLICSQSIQTENSKQDTYTLTVDDGKFDLWTLNNPKLYTCVCSLIVDGIDVDRYIVNFGVREAKFEADGFYLNGEKIKLIGLNRHQNYPYIGAAVPKRLQQKDANIIKFELGCNIVRTSHYPQSRHFLDRCDEIGLLVFEEIPGWQHIGDEDWQQLVLRDVRAMIERDRNHPSIIIWGVRVNESWDNSELYSASNQLAHELDETRQTGGVRFFLGSEFLEDVYTFNDFSGGVMEPEETPHLITEFAGHMFPTKSWDPDARRVRHALYHANVQNLQMGTENVAGAIGWCAFDYNTHKEFGAGDRICYHGVMDIFRLPKYAAYFYSSQKSPDDEIVLKVASNWALGDRNEGLLEQLVVFSNCDEIEVYVGDVLQGRFIPGCDVYPFLPHPPFFVTDLDAQLAHPYADLKVVGYYAGEAVAKQCIDADGQPHELQLMADDESLIADGIDMTRLVVKIVDRYGNVLPYAITAVSFDVEGDAELIGDNPFALVGGQGALYIKAGFESGEVQVTAKTARLAPVSVNLNLVNVSDE